MRTPNIEPAALHFPIARATARFAAVAALFMATTGLVGPARAAAAGTAEASTSQAPRSCASRYHNALQDLSLVEVNRLDGALNALLTTRPGIPDKWTFWHPKPNKQSSRRGADGRVLPMVLRGRVCVESQTLRNGRLRCTQWAKATPELIDRLSVYEPPTDPWPERSVIGELRFLTDTINTQGKLSAFDTDGRFYWLVRRLVEDLQLYLQQERAIGICHGLETMRTFYLEQLEPFDERVAYVRDLRQKANARLRAQLQMIDRHNLTRAKADQQQAKKMAETAARELVETAKADGREIELPPVAEVALVVPAKLADQRTDTLAEAISVVFSDLPPRKDEPERGSQRPPQTLTDAREALNNERAPNITSAHHAAIVRAMRAAEGREVALQTEAIYEGFRNAITVTLDNLGAANERTCDCR